jgi:hypothetical protein
MNCLGLLHIPTLTFVVIKVLISADSYQCKKMQFAFVAFVAFLAFVSFYVQIFLLYELTCSRTIKPFSQKAAI